MKSTSSPYPDYQQRYSQVCQASVDLLVEKDLIDIGTSSGLMAVC
jgi:hypothetical protein